MLDSFQCKKLDSWENLRGVMTLNETVANLTYQHYLKVRLNITNYSTKRIIGEIWLRWDTYKCRAHDETASCLLIMLEILHNVFESPPKNKK